MEKRGLYLAAPHGRLVYDGEKRVIATARKFDLVGERVVCSTEQGVGLAFGIAQVGDPALIDAKTFDDRFSEHRVPKASRLKWWPTKETLYLYPIQQFEPFSSPRRIEISPGTIMDMKELDFPFDLTPDTGEKHLVIPDSASTIVLGEKAMPWKPSDAAEHSKNANTPEKQRLWASRANQVLADCDGDRKECEAKAIRAANAAVSGKKKSRPELRAAKQQALDDLSINEDNTGAFQAFLEADALLSETDEKAGDDGDGEQHACTCANCKESFESDEPCHEAQCPNCDAQARGKNDSKAKKPPKKPKGDDDDGKKKDDDGKKKDDDNGKEKNGDEKKDKKAGRRFSNAIMEKLGKVQEIVADLFSHGNYDDQKEPEPDLAQRVMSGFAKGPYFKSLGPDSEGRSWFVLWPTNAYRDREGEFFATDAIKAYVARHAKEDVKGVVDFLHTPGSEFGTVRHQADVADHFACQLATYDDTPIGQAFKAFFTKYPDSHPDLAPDGWGTSHEFYYIGSDRADGVFTVFDTIKSTVLPLHRAANVHNPSPQMGGFKMNEEQRKAFDLIGASVGVPDFAAQIVAVGASAKAKLDDGRVQRKSVESAEEQVPEAEDESLVAPDPIVGSGNEVDPVEALAGSLAEHLGLDELSKAFATLTEGQKQLEQQVKALSADTKSAQTDKKEDLAQSLGAPRWSWQQGFQASKENATITDSSKSAPLTGLPGVVQRIAAS